MPIQLRYYVQHTYLALNEAVRSMPDASFAIPDCSFVLSIIVLINTCVWSAVYVDMTAVLAATAASAFDASAAAPPLRRLVYCAHPLQYISLDLVGIRAAIAACELPIG
jgi:hypothetical protein